MLLEGEIERGWTCNPPKRSHTCRVTDMDSINAIPLPQSPASKTPLSSTHYPKQGHSSRGYVCQSTIIVVSQRVEEDDQRHDSSTEGEGRAYNGNASFGVGEEAVI